MPKIAEICEVLHHFAPLELAAAWDNPGLLLGDAGAECCGVMTALDLSADVIEQAQAKGCNLILTHHPFIFHGQKQVLPGCYEGGMITALIKADMAAIACHTNWDNAPGGINWALAEALGLVNVVPIIEPGAGEDILLLAGDFPQALSAQNLLKTAAQALGLPVIRASGLCADKTYRRLAVCGGAGMDLWPRAQAAGCDAFLSSDPRHHEGLQAAAAGFAVLDGTHFATEIIGIRRLARLLRQQMPGLAVYFAEAVDSWQFYSVDGAKI